jgi:serine phosphatase RsbU (regulator of sigma subunit)/ligand-binding sensor domain-containing protein
VKKLFFIFIFIAWKFTSFSQEGNYYITNFTPSAYGASDQNWSITQDSLGRMFVANLSGVMMYDGVYWKIITIDQEKECVSLAKSNNGTIYAGGSGEFGFIEEKERGTYRYISLSKSLNEKEKDFGNIWAIHAIGNNIFFCANERIFWYQDNKFKKSFTPTGEKFHTFFNVGNTLIVREQGVGLSFFKDGSLKKILGTGELADVRVYATLQKKDNLYWLFSRNGLYALYFNVSKPEISNLARVKSPIDNWMAENSIYCGAKLNENLFALGSIKKGVLLVDNNCNIVNSINYEKSLQDDAVKYIFKDFSGNIWMALNKGVSYVEINSPITYLGKSNRVTSTIEAISKLDGALFIATDKGVEKLNPLTNIFEPTSITDQSWDLALYGNNIFAGTNDGLYRIDRSSVKKFTNINEVIKKVFFLPGNQGYMFLASDDYLLYVQYKNEDILLLDTFTYATHIESFAVDNNDAVFFGSSSGEVFMRDPKKPDTLINLPAKEQNKNTNTIINVANCNGKIIFINDGIIKTTAGRSDINIIKDPRFNIKELSKLILYQCIVIKNEVLLTSTAKSDEYELKDNAVFTVLETASNPDSSYILKKNHFLYRIRGVSKIHCNFVDTSCIYLGTENGLYMYNFNKKETFYKFNSFISRVCTKTDTIENFTNLSVIPLPELTYKNNKITFKVSASDFYNVKLLEFSYYLEGKDTSYGAWTLNNEIVYSNLTEGKYTFHLKSRNIIGIEGNPVQYMFVILPPWYRTYWAYALYFFSSVGLIWFIVQFNIKRLKEQNIKLEKIIAERTKEVELQKEEIEHKNHEITDSINYAKRIQQAILPPIPDIKKVWKNLFVFFQPKDIVSGDFYWFNKVSDNEMLIACADCTGHGVPGGFMSMICSDKLNDAVKLTQDPAEILFHVNNNVKTALRQTETSDENVNKDGMEISLVKIDFAQKKVWYAGANRPLWFLKNTGTEIEEIKPTKASIASFTAFDFKYQAHELQLEKGDLVYLTSDGYPDQFGGQDGKKFMTKNFKKLILSIKDLGIPEQESTIKNIINQWMSGYEQVDDLLVIGFRI